MGDEFTDCSFQSIAVVYPVHFFNSLVVCHPCGRPYTGTRAQRCSRGAQASRTGSGSELLMTRVMKEIIRSWRAGKISEEARVGGEASPAEQRDWRVQRGNRGADASRLPRSFEEGGEHCPVVGKAGGH